VRYNDWEHGGLRFSTAGKSQRDPMIAGLRFPVSSDGIRHRALALQDFVPRMRLET